MLIKKVMFVVIFATVANSSFGADMGFLNQVVGEYGPQNNAITQAALDRVLEECKKVTDWNDVSQLPWSSVLRAQLSNDTTSAQLGNSDSFRRLFPVNSGAIAEEFKKLVAADSTQASRNTAINRIMELRSAAPEPVEEVVSAIDLSNYPYYKDEIAGLLQRANRAGVSKAERQAINQLIESIRNDRWYKIALGEVEADQGTLDYANALMNRPTLKGFTDLVSINDGGFL